MNLSRDKFKKINLNDPFFDSLKDDYKEFPEWFAKKGEDLAYVFRNDSGMIDGFLYLKIEDGSLTEVTPPLPAARRIKVGTLKINAHGTKLGERFIKKIFDHALSESVDEVYVTVFAKHAPLVALLEKYGFSKKAEKHTENGQELVLVKALSVPFTDVIKNYPAINLKGQRAYLLALHPEWHTRLLPDSILNNENQDIVQDISHTNSIHKVYLAAMKGMDTLQRGDVLLIYCTSDNQGPAHYRSVATSICVVEEYRAINSYSSEADFLKYCRPYSVFTETELKNLWREKKYPHVIRFSYNIALKRRVTRGTMTDELGFDRDAYWGFMPISEKQLLSIATKGLVDESLIIH